MKPMTHEEAELMVAKYEHAPFALIRAVESYHGLFEDKQAVKPPVSFTHDENGYERN